MIVPRKGVEFREQRAQCFRVLFLGYNPVNLTPVSKSGMNHATHTLTVVVLHLISDATINVLEVHVK